MPAKGIYIFIAGAWQLRTYVAPPPDPVDPPPSTTSLLPSNILVPSNTLVPKG